MCAVHKILQELRAQMENSEDKCLAAGESGELLFSSQKQGIAPLLDLYQQYPGAAPYICDRVFGKAEVIVASLCGDREIFSFVASWNNYFIPALVLDSADKKTLPILIAQLRSADFLKFDMGKVYMMVAISILPVIIVFLLLSKFIVRGVALGGVKG